MRKEGIDPGAAKAYNKLYRKIIGYSITETDSMASTAKVMKAFASWKTTMTPQQLKELDLEDEEAAKIKLKQLFTGLQQPWLKYFVNSDASLNYQKAYSPVLALNGSEDIQVIAKKNLPAIKLALQKSRSKNYLVKELPGLNHLFQHCKKCSLSEYGELEETFAPEALEIIGAWLEKNARK